MADAAWQSVRLQEQSVRLQEKYMWAVLFGTVLAALTWMGFTGEDIVRHARAFVGWMWPTEPEARELNWELVTDPTIDFNLIR